MQHISIFQPAQPQKDRGGANRHPRQSGRCPEGHRRRQCYNVRVMPSCSVAIIFGPQATSYRASILDLSKFIGSTSKTELSVKSKEDEMPVVTTVICRIKQGIQVRRAIGALVVVWLNEDKEKLEWHFWPVPSQTRALTYLAAITKLTNYQQSF